MQKQTSSKRTETRGGEGLGAEAADMPNALSPLVGLSRHDVLSAVGAILGGAVRSPFRVMQHMGSFGREMVDIVTGGATLEPDPKDRRFTDAAWRENFLYRRLAQTWMALGKETQDFINGLEMSDVDRARALLVAGIAVDAVAPTNALIGNPAAIKKAIDTGGASILRGLKNLVTDLRHNGMMPSQVDKTPFKVGENLATTKGEVVFKTDMLELIQYAPRTEQVFEIPLLIVPPQINKYYVMDLDPPKSLIRYLLKQGHQVFVVSWRNPQSPQSHWGLETYVGELVGAIDVVLQVAKVKKLNVSGGCSGGITTATLLSHLAAEKKPVVNAVTFMVCVLDPKQTDSDFGVLVTRRGIEMARRRSAKKGVLSGADLGRTFAWLRPNDLIWNYVINNYLLGLDPPAFDVLFWNADATNLSASLMGDFLTLYETLAFSNPGTVEMAGHTIDLTKVTADLFILGGVTDHITPWKATYRSTQLFGSKDVTYVLSQSGHMQAILNPPTNPKAKYFIQSKKGKLPATADEWLQGTQEVKGSWWPLWAEWVQARAGKKKPAPQTLGSEAHPPTDPAPGLYVIEEV